LDEPSHAEQTKGLSNRSEGVTYLLEGLGRSDIKKAGLNKEEERANRAGNPGLSLKDPDEENNAACLMPTSCPPHASHAPPHARAYLLELARDAQLMLGKGRHKRGAPCRSIADLQSCWSWALGDTILSTFFFCIPGGSSNAMPCHAIHEMPGLGLREVLRRYGLSQPATNWRSLGCGQQGHRR
jgi:hypothetical protein